MTAPAVLLAIVLTAAVMAATIGAARARLRRGKFTKEEATAIACAHAAIENKRRAKSEVRP